MGARGAADPLSEAEGRGDVSMIVIAHNFVQVFEIADRSTCSAAGRSLRPPHLRTSVDN
jgi:ABC-type sugar transport system ATPase subunit